MTHEVHRNLREPSPRIWTQSSIVEAVREEVELRLSQKYNIKRVVSQVIINLLNKIEDLLLTVSELKQVCSTPPKVNTNLGVDRRGRDVAVCLQMYVTLLIRRGVKVHTLLVLGSRAKGRARPQSDVDVTIIASDLPGKNTFEFTDLAQKIMNVRKEILLCDFPLLIGVQPSSCCSKCEFIRWLKDFKAIALDAVYYGKVIYDDGFWNEVKSIFEGIEKKYNLNETEVPALLFAL